MIRKLTGFLDSAEGDSLVIDVGGVGYEVSCCQRLLAQLPAPGAPLSLLISSVSRDEGTQLFGFTSQHEANCFRALMRVQGVGARLALAILNTLEPHEIAAAIAASSPQTLSAAPGVGPRLAQRIVLEMKNTLLLPPQAQNGAASPSSLLPQTVLALVNLGYPQASSVAAAAAAAKEEGEGATLASLIRASLKALAP